ncbi:hypothetical protein [Streptomyces sp. NPDC002611]
MTRSTRVLGWAYLLAALLTAHCAVISARNEAWWYGAGLFGVSLLLIVALAREYIATDERRAAAVKAQRAARLRAQQDTAALGWADLERSCCLLAALTGGADHDTDHCSRKDTAA